MNEMRIFIQHTFELSWRKQIFFPSSMKAAVAQVIKYTGFLEFKAVLSANVVKRISVFSALTKNVSCHPSLRNVFFFPSSF